MFQVSYPRILKASVPAFSTIVLRVKREIGKSFFKVFFFFWEESTFSDAGSDGTQPASCVDIQNRQSTYSCRCSIYGACQNDVFCGLFYSASLAILRFFIDTIRQETPVYHLQGKRSYPTPPPNHYTKAMVTTLKRV